MSSSGQTAVVQEEIRDRYQFSFPRARKVKPRPGSKLVKTYPFTNWQPLKTP